MAASTGHPRARGEGVPVSAPVVATCRDGFEVWGLQANGEVVLEKSSAPKRAKHAYFTDHNGDRVCEVCGKRKPKPHKKGAVKWRCAVCKKPSATHIAFCSKACEQEAAQYEARANKKQTQREKEFGRRSWFGQHKGAPGTEAFEQNEYKWNGELNDRP